MTTDPAAYVVDGQRRAVQHEERTDEARVRPDIRGQLGQVVTAEALDHDTKCVDGDGPSLARNRKSKFRNLIEGVPLDPFGLITAAPRPCPLELRLPSLCDWPAYRRWPR